jgi:hypothetical protein
MKIYESSGSVKKQTGGGGFNPVTEPDVASAMERELRAGMLRLLLKRSMLTLMLT